jgi:peptide/nickel transport system ATP-binding protein
LLNSIPRLSETALGTDGAIAGDDEHARLAEIPGTVPSLKEPIAGCVFAPRCAYATERCRAEYPPLEQKADGHWVACWEAARLAAPT